LLHAIESHILRGLFLYGFSQLDPIDAIQLLELRVSPQRSSSNFGGAVNDPYY